MAYKKRALAPKRAVKKPSILGVGYRIEALRHKRHWSLSELAEKVQVDMSIVSRWERCEGFPNIWHLAELCKAFKVSADYLLLGFGETYDANAQHKNDVHPGRGDGDGRSGLGLSGPEDSDMGERLQRDEGFIPGGAKALPRSS